MGHIFGDIYAGHEALHWWFILLGHLYRKPLFLYATSAGPFKNGMLNPLRRWLYPKFVQLVTREELSASYIKELMGADTKVTITADSAIQQQVAPFCRADYFRGNDSQISERLLVAVSLNNHRYPDARCPKTQQALYDRELAKVLRHLVDKHRAHLMLFPQLYGAAHNDVPYLERIAKELPEHASWEIVDPEANSDRQRALFAMCDIHLASRYHPAIFGNTGFVPGICIYYEHKAQGFMDQLGLEQYAFDIAKPDAHELCRALDEIIDTREKLASHLRMKIPELQRRSRSTTEMAIQYLSA